MFTPITRYLLYIYIYFLANYTSITISLLPIWNVGNIQKLGQFSILNSLDLGDVSVMPWKNMAEGGDRNVLSWKHLADSHGDRNVQSGKICLKAEVTEMACHECTKVLEED